MPTKSRARLLHHLRALGVPCELAGLGMGQTVGEKGKGGNEEWPQSSLVSDFSSRLSTGAEASRGQQRPAERARGGALPQLAACSPPSKGGPWTVPDDDLRGASPTWPECEALTGHLSLYPYLILSQFKHDLCVCPFFYLACLPLCVCWVCLLSLIQSLFVPMSVSALWSCVSLSLTISLPVPLCRCVLSPAPHWDSVCEGGQILGARTPGLPGEGPSFPGVTAKPRILSTSHFSPASRVLGLGKGKWRGPSPDFSMPGQGAPQPQPVLGLVLRQQHPD